MKREDFLNHAYGKGLTGEAAQQYADKLWLKANRFREILNSKKSEPKNEWKGEVNNNKTGSKIAEDINFEEL